MNRVLLRLFVSLFDTPIGYAEQFRYEDAINKDFWSGIRRDLQTGKK